MRQQIKIRKRTVFIFLTLIGLLAYFNSFGVPFHYDDISFLREKTIIKSFQLFSDWITEDYSRIITERAFLLFTFYLNYVINGLDTFGYHIVNLLIHISTAFLFYLLISRYVYNEKTVSKRDANGNVIPTKVGIQKEELKNGFPPPITTFEGMLKNCGNDGKRELLGHDSIKIVPILAASIFLLHPIATESVTYISSRSSVLSAFFMLASMLCFFRATQVEGTEGVVNSSFPDSILRSCRRTEASNKGTGFPLSWERRLDSRLHGNDTKTRLIFYLLSILFFILGLSTKESAIVTPLLILLFDLYFISDNGKDFRSRLKYHLPFWLLIFAGSFYYLRYITNPAMSDRLWQTHILTELKVFVEYLRLLILPFGLNICHYIKESSLFDKAVILSIGIIIGLFLVAILLKNKNRILSFSIFWFFLNLSPFLIIRLEDYMAERWVYAAALGFSLGIGELMIVLFSKYRRSGIVAIICTTILLGVLTHMRNDIYKDPVALWTDALKKSPERHRPYSNLSAAYLERGDIEKVIEITELSIKKGNREIAVYLNLANAYFLKGNPKKTEEILLSLTKREDPEVYYKLGVIYMLQKKYEKAIEEFEKVAKIRPHSPAVLGSIGECYSFLNQKDRAKEYFILATKGIPQHSEDYLILAKSYFNLGDKQKGAESLNKALVSDPLNIYIRNMIATTLLENNHFDAAFKHFSIIVKLSPQYAPAYKGMGQAMLAMGNHKEARRHFNKALSLLPQASLERKELLELLAKTGG
jgi:tetratricopeptide (TPR) repeat protein